MEQILGRPLLETEDVHHKDENPLNNNPDNLEVIDHVVHTKNHAIKYQWTDKKMKCPICGKSFIWTAKQQENAFKNSNRKDRINRKNNGPFCSKKCAGIYSQRIQMKYKNQKI